MTSETVVDDQVYRGIARQNACDKSSYITRTGFPEHSCACMAATALGLVLTVEGGSDFCCSLYCCIILLFSGIGLVCLLLSALLALLFLLQLLELST